MKKKEQHKTFVAYLKGNNNTIVMTNSLTQKTKSGEINKFSSATKIYKH